MAGPRNKAATVEAPPEDSVDVVDEPQALVGDNEIEVVGGDDYDMDEALGAPEPAGPPGDLTTTESFYGGAPAAAAIVDEVQEMQTVVVDDVPQAKRIVVVVEDIGPVFYGEDKIELKKGVKYRVPEHIFRYLNERNLIWSIS